MKALHITLKAFTATFKMPFINTGVAISMPVPSYSTIVGLISCCVGRWIEKDETLIGFKYEYEGMGRDLETTRRLGVDNKGNLKRVPEPGIGTREFHVNPVLDIYLTNIEFEKYFYNPVGVPVLGRSQDVAWITKVEKIDIDKVESGRIKPTLVPFPCSGMGGRIVRCCDYFNNDRLGCFRTAERAILYQVVPYSKDGVYIRRDNLFTIPRGIKEEVIYMHKLGEEL